MNFAERYTNEEWTGISNLYEQQRYSTYTLQTEWKNVDHFVKVSYYIFQYFYNKRVY